MKRIVMVDPVGTACNLRCRYCYQESVREDIRIMPREILEKLTMDALQLGKEIRFLWHGGEPLLAGKEFFRQAYQFQQKFQRSHQHVENHMQTNATLIDKDWASFLVDHGFKVGTSLDGPRSIHNSVRDASFTAVVQGIRNLQAAGATAGVVVTVSKFNVNHPEQIWKKLILPNDLAHSWEINICVETGVSNFTPSKEDSIRFWITLFDLWWENDNANIRVNPYWTVLRALLGGTPGDCAFEYNKCKIFSAVDEVGDVYTCNRFLKRKVAHLGNIKEESLKNILESEKAEILYRKIAGLKPECKQCKWLLACGGGCAFQRWLSKGRFDAGFPECEVRKALFSHIEKRMQDVPYRNKNGQEG